jgi:hypothetical protein
MGGSTMGKRAFISQISEEAKVAALLKKALIRDFLVFLEVFVSSDGESISAGDDWLKSIDEALREASVVMICAAHPRSVGRGSISRPGRPGCDRYLLFLCAMQA